MKSIIYRNPHLAVRIVVSVVLQIVLVVLLSQPHQDSTLFNLSLLIIAALAMVPLSVCPSHSNLRTAMVLGLVGLFPQFVILATMLHLLGWSGLLHWLLRLL